jgi:pyruvate,water dikinase
MQNKVRSFAELTVQEMSVAGGKGAALARLYQSDYPVPDGLVILPGAFNGDELEADAWQEVQVKLGRLGDAHTQPAFAVRSSALSEDSEAASFAGEFETVLGVSGVDEIHLAIDTVRGSRHSERVGAYSQAKQLSNEHDMAVIVQLLIPADISGVLFTADPLTGSHTSMSGNYVHGSGEGLVAGKLQPYTFSFEKPRGRYEGPAELKPFAKALFKLANRVEREMGGPQDIEWAIAGKRVYLLQSRPITTMQGFSPINGEWNDSLTGDYVWSCVNIGEAMSVVMTPFSYSLVSKMFDELNIVPGYASTGNIGGRPYTNVTVLATMMRALGRKMEDLNKEMGGVRDEYLENIDQYMVTLPGANFFSILPNALRMRKKQKDGLKNLEGFLHENPVWCRETCQRIQVMEDKQELALLITDETLPLSIEAFWKVAATAWRNGELTGSLRRDLIDLVGAEDADALLSSVSSKDELLPSLGPVVSLAKVARGEMSREAYLEKWGHRGAFEMEASIPRPFEEPEWLDRQLADFGKSAVDVEELLAAQRDKWKAAWERFKESYPGKVKATRRRLEEAASATRMREAVRSETTRMMWVARTWVLRVGALTSIGEGAFYLTFEELLDLLEGKGDNTAYIPARRQTYERYKSLPPYPLIIRGRFDPFQWAEDPQRDSNVYDSHGYLQKLTLKASNENVILGMPGSAGRVEGIVRCIMGPEEGVELQEGEILVTSQTNIGWTMLFPRLAGIVTDVGAPLSHAAIVAREMGIPAVVNCGDATTRLRTGDRVRLDGSQGFVEILSGGDASVEGVERDEVPEQPASLMAVPGYDLTWGEWNASLNGDYLWSNVNFGEAVSEAMTPLSWTVLTLILEEWTFLPGYPSVGNIAGRPYLNISLFATVLGFQGKDEKAILKALEGTVYTRLPEGMEIPRLPVSRWTVLSNLPGLLRLQMRQRRAVKALPVYLASNPDWFKQMRSRVQGAKTKSELLSLWQEEIKPHVTGSVWGVLGSASHSSDYTSSLRRELVELVGTDDAHALIANVSKDSDMLASLGPLVGLSQVVRGESSRAAYLEQYGHRGPHEFELSVPRPAEDPRWLNQQLAQLEASPVDVEAILAEGRAEYQEVWERFVARYPRRAEGMQARLEEAGARARLREEARSEYVRDRWMMRIFALRAGELGGLGEGIFFLTFDELLDLLEGGGAAAGYIPARRETYRKLRALPACPPVIRGQFDPFQWATDPHRRSDFYDAHTPLPGISANADDALVISGSPGAVGCVEGRVRLLEKPEQGIELLEGEILVTAQTDIAWTPLFPRAAAIVTDVGAPLSHAAIIARELGIPAVVGCADATMRLKTGDLVRIDGGQGRVEIMER